MAEVLETRAYFALLSFMPAVSSAAGADPHGLATGDFNSDGKLDVVVANPGAGSVGFLAGNGNGTFAAPVTIAIGGSPTSVTSADLNADGKRDLIITGNDVAVALGNGDGTFSTPVHVAVGTGPRTPVVAAINADGHLDLAVPVANDNKLSVLLGNGDGTFATPVDFSAGVMPVSVAAADFDGDGDLDFAVADLGASADGAGAGVTILANNGSGTFQAQTTIPAGARPSSIDVGPLNGDGDPDLVVANGGDGTNIVGENSISVFLGGDGLTFTSPTNYATGTGPQSVRIGNLNLDGTLDIATANIASGDVSVFIGHGDGTFASGLTFASGTGTTNLARAEVNGDAATDLLTVNSDSDTVSALLNGTQGTVPTAAVDASQPSPVAGDTSYSFTVNYSDVDGINIGSLGDDDVVVAPPGGGQKLAASFVGTGTTTATSVEATYRIAAPGGTLDPADNGTYSVSLNEGSVLDSTGDAAASGAIGEFSLDVPAVPPGPLPDLTAAVTGKIPSSVVAGAKASASVTVANAGDAAVDATVRVNLVVSADSTPDDSDLAVGIPIERRLRLKPGKHKVYRIKFVVPNATDGMYSLLGIVDGTNAVTEKDETNNIGATGPFTLQHAFVDLTGDAPIVSATLIAAGKSLTARLNLENHGSVPARGSVKLDFFAADPNGVNPDLFLNSKELSLSIPPNGAKKIPIKILPAASVPTGTYLLRFTISPEASLIDEDSTNNQLTSVVELTFS